MTLSNFQGNDSDHNLAILEKQLVTDLERRYGALISGENLRLILGYPSLAAFRQAHSRGVLPIPVFAIAHRKGKFALVRDVAQWLAKVRLSAQTNIIT